MRKDTILNKFQDKKSLNIGLISDTHFAVHRKINIFHKHMVDAADEFITQCEKHNVDFIVHCGDLFDTKMEIATTGLIKTNDLINKISSKFPIMILPGNHDFAYKENNQFNLASNYKHQYNVTIFEEYEKLYFAGSNTTLHFLPYHDKPREAIKKITVDKKHQNVLFGHMGVLGFAVHAYASRVANQVSAQIKQKTVAKFDQVFLGHYHGYQSKNNVTYVSAPLQSRHGDEKSKHGFVFWNTAKEKHVFTENTHTPQFKTFDLTKSNAQKMLQLKDHYIRMVIKKKVSKDLLIALRRKLLKKNYEVKEKFEFIDDMKLAVIDGWKDFVIKDPDSFIMNYIEILEEQDELPYDKTELLRLLDINIK